MKLCWWITVDWVEITLGETVEADEGTWLNKKGLGGEDIEEGLDIMIGVIFREEDTGRGLEAWLVVVVHEEDTGIGAGRVLKIMLEVVVHEEDTGRGLEAWWGDKVLWKDVIGVWLKTWFRGIILGG